MAELISKRYASALFDIAFEEQNYEDVKEQLNFIIDCLKEEPQLYQLLKSPLISINEKKDVLSAIFKDRPIKIQGTSIKIVHIEI